MKSAMIILCYNTIIPTCFILIQMNYKLDSNKGLRKIVAKDMKHKLFVGLKDDLRKLGGRRRNQDNRGRTGKRRSRQEGCHQCKRIGGIHGQTPQFR